MRSGGRSPARRLCRSSAEGDDLFQEAVLRALTRIGDLRDDRAFPAWFYRILVSLHRTRARRTFWRRFLPLDTALPPGHEPAGDDGSQWEDQRHRAQRMRQALANLPAVQREAVVLFELSGHSLKDIAAIQKVSLSAVKSRLTRARARLRSYYAEHAPQYAQRAPPWSERTAAAATLSDERSV